MEQELNDFVRFLKEIKKASNNTVQAYQNDLRKLLFFLEKQNITTVNKISETSLNSYILSLEKEGLSPASVTRNIASMKAFLLYLIKHGELQGDPSERIKPPKVDKKAPYIPPIALVDQLLTQPDLTTRKGIRDKAMLELLYATGLKVSELIAIKTSDINLSSGYITCRGVNKERNIPIGRTAVKALQSYLEKRTDLSIQTENDFLFLNSIGKQISRQGFWKILKFYAKAAGLADITPNTLRHSFAAHLIENGADIESVQEFMGHSDITTTGLYLKSRNQSSREVYMKSHPRA